MLNTATLRRTAIVAITLTAALFVSSCSGTGAAPEESQGSEGPAELIEITVGALPIIDTAALFVGIDQGFFEEEGLSVTTKMANSGSATVSELLAGETQFAFTGWMPFLQAREAGVPIQAVANSHFHPHETMMTAGVERSAQDIVVAADSPIQTPADLEGKVIATNALRGVQEVALRHALESHGVLQDSVEIVELPIPTMVDSVLGGQVDAAFAVDPFLTRSLQAGGIRIVMHPYLELDEPMNVSLYIASDAYAAANPDIVQQFQRAMAKSLNFANENHDAARAAVAGYTEIPNDVLEEISLPVWSPLPSKASIEEQARYAVQFGALKSVPDVAAYVSTISEG